MFSLYKEECAVPLDISDEVLQMYEEISDQGTYDYMICKCNNGRLVIEHIECLSRDIQGKQLAPYTLKGVDLLISLCMERNRMKFKNDDYSSLMNGWGIMNKFD